MYVRVSRGRFAPAQYDEIAERLRAAELVLAPAIRGLPGLIDYYAGMDCESSSMIRVSIWDTRDHADGMGSLREVADSRELFAAAGVAWEPIDTYDVSWWVQSP